MTVYGLAPSAVMFIVPEITPVVAEMLSPGGRPAAAYVRPTPYGPGAASGRVTGSPAAFCWAPGFVSTTCVAAQQHEIHVDEHA